MNLIPQLNRVRTDSMSCIRNRPDFRIAARQKFVKLEPRGGNS
jgi:hypothetical protein